MRSPRDDVLVRLMVLFVLLVLLGRAPVLSGRTRRRLVKKYTKEYARPQRRLGELAELRKAMAPGATPAQLGAIDSEIGALRRRRALVANRLRLLDAARRLLP